MRKAIFRTVLLAAVIVLAAAAAPNKREFAMHPSSMEMTLLPGEHATVTFYVESADWMTPPRVELVANLVDWRMERDGTTRYVGPGTWRDSASAWAMYSPGIVSLGAGRVEPIHATISVPTRTEPGVYRTGILIEPKGALPKNMDARDTKFTGVFRITVRVLPERSEVMEGN